MIRNARARSETLKLLRRYHGEGDTGARQALIVDSLPLVRALAHQYAGRGEPFEDLVQVGMVGLIKAVDRFDTSRGVEFSTYATAVVVGEIKRYFRDSTAMVRVSRPTQELCLRIRKTTGPLAQTLGREPTIAELAEALDAPVEAVIDGIEAGRSFHVESLSPRDGHDGDLIDPFDAVGADDGGLSRWRNRAFVWTGLAALDRRERQVIVLRHVYDLTQSQIAERVGYSQMHVSRLLQRATRKMQLALSAGEELAA